MASDRRFIARICLDFDGVLTTGGRWLGPEVCDGVPTAGMVEWVNAASEFYQIAVFSCRSETAAGRATMRAWLAEQGVDVERLEFPEHKPPALAYVDDRGYRFEGRFPAPTFLTALRPWDR